MAEDENINYYSKILNYSHSDPIVFWIAVFILLLLLFFIFKPKKSHDFAVGMNPFEWEVFKRRNK